MKGDGIEKYDPKSYYTENISLQNSNKPLYIPLVSTKKGFENITKYYKEKYDIDYQLIYGSPHTYTKNEHDHIELKKSHVIDALQDIITQYADCPNVRVPILIGFDETGDVTHSCAYIYVKENGKEALIISDSAGSSAKNIIFPALEQLQIPVYLLGNSQQLSSIGCISSAITISRDICKKTNNKFILENIIEQVSESTTPCSNFKNIKYAKPPEILLRGPQRPQFYNDNKKDGTEKIYKGKSIDELRKQDSLKAFDIDKDKTIEQYNLYLLYRRGYKEHVIAAFMDYREQLQTKFGQEAADEFTRKFDEIKKTTNLEQKVSVLVDMDDKIFELLYEHANKIHEKCNNLSSDNCPQIENESQEIDTETVCNEFLKSIQDCETIEDILMEKEMIRDKFVTQINGAEQKICFKTRINILKELDKIAETKIAELKCSNSKTS